MQFLSEEHKRAAKKAMKLLEHMDRTEKGLRDRLHQAGFGQDAIEAAMAYVESYGYIDDYRYARTYIAYRMDAKSRQKVMQELAAKGVDRSVAAAAWEEEAALHAPDEREILRREVEKKYAPGARQDEKEMRRLYGYLGRRGFQFSDISSVLEELKIQVTPYSNTENS